MTDLRRPSAASLSAPSQRTADPARWFTVIGALSVITALYLLIAWIASGDAMPVPTGPDPVPPTLKTTAWAIQVFGVVTFIGAVIYVGRRSRREGRLTFDGLILIAWTVIFWMDPATMDYFRTQFLFNSYYWNFGSWAHDIPGWLAPHDQAPPEPLIAWGTLYGVSGVLGAIVCCRAMRLARTRWPRLGNVGLVGVALATAFVIDTGVEVIWIRTGIYIYPGAIRALSLSPGTIHQYPLYESLLFGATWAATGALRYYRNDRGLSIVERTRDGAALNNSRRILAATGFLTIAYGLYCLAYSLTALWGDPWPDGLPSYFTNGLCGAQMYQTCPHTKAAH